MPQECSPPVVQIFFALGKGNCTHLQHTAKSIQTTEHKQHTQCMKQTEPGRSSVENTQLPIQHRTLASQGRTDQSVQSDMDRGPGR